VVGLLALSGCGKTPVSEALAETGPSKSLDAPSGDKPATDNARNATQPGARSETNTATDRTKGSTAKDDDREKSPADQDRAGGNPAKKTEPDEAEELFPNRVPAPPLPANADWINTAGPVDLRDLRGKFVVLDFWTYCCINCMHLLPELKKLEHAFPKNVVVIGVHSAKFQTEEETQNIKDAVLRYEIEHPVVNDANHAIWNRFGVQSWPTVVVIDPEGNVIARDSGEIPFEALKRFFDTAIASYRKRGLLDETPVRFDLERYSAPSTPLRFPGKVLADAVGKRLFIADSNHNRIVIARLDGTLIETIGHGTLGSSDGDYQTAEFNRPQGICLRENMLYVADTENHLLRKIDLDARRVKTIAGTGKQGHGWPGLDRQKLDPLGQPLLPDRWAGKPLETALSSPWDLWIHDRTLYLAMAGPHQIWSMPLDESEIAIYAGNGREDIVDGPLLPKQPYELGFASFAQPSGLTADDTWLYVADSEGSSIRKVPFDSGQPVETLLGTSRLPAGRLFTFGDVDGKADEVRFQHPLGVAFYEGKLYVADTYNNRIKVVDVRARTARSLAGTGEPGKADDPAQFNEPAGLSAAEGKLYVADTDNHLIRVIDLNNEGDLSDAGRASTLRIRGLQAPPSPKPKVGDDFAGGEHIELPPATIRPSDGVLRLDVRLEFPQGVKLNQAAPLIYRIKASGDVPGPVDREQVGTSQHVTPPAAKFPVHVPLVDPPAGSDRIEVSVGFYYCKTGAEGVCKAGTVTWIIPLKIDADGKSNRLELTYRPTPDAP